MSYSAKPSIIFKLKDGIAKFMDKANGGTSSKKDVLEKLADDYSMRIVETSTDDEDRVGFKGLALYDFKYYVKRDISVHTMYCYKVATRCLCCRWAGVLAARLAPSGHACIAELDL